MSRTTRFLVALALIASSVLASACSGGDDDAAEGPTTTTEAEVADEQPAETTEPADEAEEPAEPDDEAPTTTTEAAAEPAGDDPVVVDPDGTVEQQAARRAAFEGMVSAEQLACLFPSAQQPGAPVAPGAESGCGITASQGFAAELYLSAVGGGATPAQAACLRDGVASVPIEQVQGGAVDLAGLAGRCGVPPELLATK